MSKTGFLMWWGSFTCITDHSKAMFLLCFVLIVIVYPPSVCLWNYVHFVWESLMSVCWERVVLSFGFPLVQYDFMLSYLALCCLIWLYAVLLAVSLSPFFVWGRMWNLIVKVPDHCLFIYVKKRLKNVEFNCQFNTLYILQMALDSFEMCPETRF